MADRNGPELRRYDGFVWRDLRFFEKLRMYWEFLWRALFVGVVAGLSGWALGGLVVTLLGGGGVVSGASVTRVLMTTWLAKIVVSLLVGVIALFWYISWMMGSRFGGLRIGYLKEIPAEKPKA